LRNSLDLHGANAQLPAAFPELPPAPFSNHH